MNPHEGNLVLLLLEMEKLIYLMILAFSMAISHQRGHFSVDEGFPRYWRHSSGVSLLIISIFSAELVKGMASMSNSFGA